MIPSSIPMVTDPLDIGSHLPSYLGAIERGDRREAVDIALGLLERGADAESIITDLVAAAQREVGRQWQQGRYSIAVEHRASGIAESALQAVSDTAMRAPGSVEEGSVGRAVIACSEGEWHVLPGRMATEVLRLRGIDVSFVGPSVPARDLAEMLGDDPPAIVAVTCSMSMSLTGAWSTICALREVGMTILCAGRGFGYQGKWGLRLGADLWAPDFASGADLLIGNLDLARPHPRPPAGRPEFIEETRILGRDHQALVEAAYGHALSTWPQLRESDATMGATRDDLSSTLRTLASAALADDDSITTDYVSWFEIALAARDLPLAYVPTAFTLLLDVLPADLTNVRSQAYSGLDACSAAAL